LRSLSVFLKAIYAAKQAGLAMGSLVLYSGTDKKLNVEDGIIFEIEETLADPLLKSYNKVVELKVLGKGS
jgi:hypothetical protein